MTWRRGGRWKRCGRIWILCFTRLHWGTGSSSPGGAHDQMVPAFRVDVRDHGDEVIVVADLPGLKKENVTLQLLNPRALEISYERREEKEEKSGGYYVKERISGSMQRVVALPADVLEDNAKVTFKNGVLEITLKKTTIPEKSRQMIQ